MKYIILYCLWLEKFIKSCMESKDQLSLAMEACWHNLQIKYSYTPWWALASVLIQVKRGAYFSMLILNKPGTKFLNKKRLTSHVLL
jgi:hypothetical protein